MKLLLFFLLISLPCLGQRMPTIEHHRDSANTAQFKVTVPRDYMPHGPWVTIGTHTYQNWAQSMWDVSDSAYTTYITFIYMVEVTVLKSRRYVKRSKKAFT